MNDLTPEVKTLLQSLEKKEKLVAMLAPSFPIVFSYPKIVGKLKRLGFARVVEVAVGAAETNRQLLESLGKSPDSRCITSPCPTIVRLVRTKYPHLVRHLADIDSPMSASAKLVVKKYPGFRPVFIGPCPAKKLEAREDRAALDILVLTYTEIEQIFKIRKIKDNASDSLANIDWVGPQTRLYPISGGLTQSAGLIGMLTDEELDVVSGLENVVEALDKFPTDRLKVLDILFCDGGCISGPGINTSLSLEQRRAKIIAHWVTAIKK